jgi:hypothetical protein
MRQYSNFKKKEYVIVIFIAVVSVVSLHKKGNVFCSPSKNDVNVPSSVVDPDPGSGAFMAPGSGMGKK